MSRIVVKNLPKRVTDSRLRELFSSKGEITDVQLKYTNDGIFRQFAFIGFKSESDATEAINYYHNTFIDTKKIAVELCAKLGSNDKPRSWSKYSADSKSYAKKFADKTDNSADDGNNASKKKDKKVKEKFDPFADVKDDPQFNEFLSLQRNVNSGNKGKHIWSDDTAIGENDNEVIAEDKEESDEEVEEVSEDETMDEEIEQVSDGSDKHIEISDKQNKKLHKTEAKPKAIPETIHSFTVKITGLPYKIKKRQLKEFLQPIKPLSLRIPPKIKGIAFVSFKTIKELKQCLIKHRGFLDGHRVDIKKYDIKQPTVANNASNNSNRKRKFGPEVPAEETIGESGRIFIRNLSYTCTEEDLRQLFSTYGMLSELHLPIDSYTKKLKGFAFVTFMFPEHAVKAFTELDGSDFQGRLLHLIPAKAKPDKVELPFQKDDENTSFKKKKEAEMKSNASSSHQWNTLFLGANALADVMADKFSIKKSDLLADSNTKDSVAVRMALGETQIVSETRRFLIKNGVKLDAFSQAATERNKNVILAKNLPARTTEVEISELFKKFGAVARVILPPSGITAIVEMQERNEAKNAFAKLAYNNFKHYPLYLEWAPHDVFSGDNPEEFNDESDSERAEQSEAKEQEVKNVDQSNNMDESGSDELEEEPEEDATLFVKNLNFRTNETDFRHHFAKCGQIISATIANKRGDDNELLSMGYGFIQFMHKKSAEKALKELQRSHLDGHSLELKISHRTTTSVKQRKDMLRKVAKAKKQTGTKIVVRNLPFEANVKEVEQLFSVFGELKKVRLPKKLVGTGTHRGFGFIDFVTKNDAKRAFNALCHSTHLYGRRLVLEWANDDSVNDDEFGSVAKSKHRS